MVCNFAAAHTLRVCRIILVMYILNVPLFRLDFIFYYCPYDFALRSLNDKGGGICFGRSCVKTTHNRVRETNCCSDEWQ